MAEFLLPALSFSLSSWTHEFIQKITYFILNQLPATFQESFKLFSVQRQGIHLTNIYPYYIPRLKEITTLWVYNLLLMTETNVNKYELKKLQMYKENRENQGSLSWESDGNLKFERHVYIW